jgi:hypothetical protein
VKVGREVEVGRKGSFEEEANPVLGLLWFSLEEGGVCPSDLERLRGRRWGDGDLDLGIGGELGIRFLDAG